MPYIIETPSIEALCVISEIKRPKTLLLTYEFGFEFKLLKEVGFPFLIISDSVYVSPTSPTTNS